MIKLLKFVLISLYSFNTLANDMPVIEIWTSSENLKRAIDQLAEPFEKKYQTKVNVSVLNRELTTQFQTAGLSGSGPDIVCWAHDVVGMLASSGLIEPLVIDPQLEKQFIPEALEAFRYQGQLYGLPYDLEAVALIRNTDLLAKAPKTFESLIEFSRNQMRKSTSHQQWGLLFDIQNFFFSFPLLSAGEGVVFRSDSFGRVNPQDLALDSEKFIKNAHFLQTLTKERIIPASTDRSIAFELFTQQRAAAIIDGPWAIRDLRRSGVPFEVTALPTLHDQTAHPFLGAHGLMIRRSSPHKKLALELIENYLVTRDGIAEIYRHDPRIPSRMDALEVLRQELTAAELQVLNAFIQSAEKASAMPNIPQMGAIWPAMGQALGHIHERQRNPSKILKQTVQNLKAQNSK